MISILRYVIERIKLAIGPMGRIVIIHPNVLRDVAVIAGAVATVVTCR